MSVCILSLFVCVVLQPASASISFQEAIQIVKKGIGSAGTEDMRAWEASQRILKTAKIDRKLLVPYKNVIVEEITRLDKWDSFTEVSGDYKLSLIKALFEIADPSLTELFLRQCQHGSFVAEGLARIGRPAIESLIEQMLRGKHSTCAQISLVRMAETKLAEDSDLSKAERDLLEEDFRNRVLPALRQRTEQTPVKDEVAFHRAADTLGELENILKKIH